MRDSLSRSKTFQSVSKFRFIFPIFAPYQKGFNQVSFFSFSFQNVDTSKRQEEELELECADLAVIFCARCPLHMRLFMINHENMWGNNNEQKLIMHVNIHDRYWKQEAAVECGKKMSFCM